MLSFLGDDSLSFPTEVQICCMCYSCSAVGRQCQKFYSVVMREKHRMHIKARVSTVSHTIDNVGSLGISKNFGAS